SVPQQTVQKYICQHKGSHQRRDIANRNSSLVREVPGLDVYAGLQLSPEGAFLDGQVCCKFVNNPVGRVRNHAGPPALLNTLLTHCSESHSHISHDRDTHKRENRLQKKNTSE